MSTCVTLLRPINHQLEQVPVKLVSLANRLSVPILLFGATARDVLFFHMHGIESGRRTMDVDISVQLPDWDAYQRLSEKM